jgi:sec-independent protein translocase protein TatA
VPRVDHWAIESIEEV